MIKKLQRRYIVISLVSLTVAMVLVVAIVNVANWISVRRELEGTLAFLSENSAMTREDMRGRMAGRSRHDRNVVGESDWFVVSLDADRTMRSMNLVNMAEPDDELVKELTDQALAGGRGAGMIRDYLYQVRKSHTGGQTVIFLDCETKLTAVRTLGWISGLACLGGILLAWLFVTLASRKAIEPTIRNMEQQKQFITNASHELKTPLTVISTNMELLQTELPDNRWVRSTQKQAAQMRHLVEELVYLSRMEEENAPLVMEALPVSALLEETAAPFVAMAEYQGKAMTVSAEKGLTVRGDRASLQRLMSTLLDNAVKYASPEGEIRAGARADGRHVLLTVSNGVDQPLTAQQCAQLFDRFYRADPSRSKEKQDGFGIGLAIAAAIVEKHGGSISAGMEGNCLVFTCRLPRGGA